MKTDISERLKLILADWADSNQGDSWYCVEVGHKNSKIYKTYKERLINEYEPYDVPIKAIQQLFLSLIGEDEKTPERSDILKALDNPVKKIRNELRQELRRAVEGEL